MAWILEYSDIAERSLRAMDAATVQRIRTYMREKVAVLENPRAVGKALSGTLRGRWRYRVGDYRIVCDIQDRRIHILVVGVGHRRDVYRQKK